eukprot:2512632-Amphidinium_carterae.1
MTFAVLLVLAAEVAFRPPHWAASLHAPRHGRVMLGHLPTPLMPAYSHWASSANPRKGLSNFEGHGCGVVVEARRYVWL